MLIFLIGYMGSGKTVTGRKIADALNYRFLDMDEMFELDAGCTVKDYFGRFGEASFRENERKLLIGHLQDKDTVIATGGGTPCYRDNMELMNKSGITVFLDTPYNMIIKRLSGKTKERPLLNRIPQGELLGFIREHMDSRRIFYERAGFRMIGEAELKVLISWLSGLDKARPGPLLSTPDSPPDHF